MDDTRRQRLVNWLESLGFVDIDCQPLFEDASFRRYFRVMHAGQSYVVMDAPPELEDCHAFVHLATELHQRYIRVPQIYQQDFSLGFLLLEDFGDCLLLQLLQTRGMDSYRQALGDLAVLRQCKDIELPEYDNGLLLDEMRRFQVWYLEKHLRLALTERQQAVLNDSFQLLADTALSQPRVFVHRDYHSRNIMVLNNGELGIIDFQDAVIGPITYDIVSLLKDCYINWPRPQVLTLLQQQWQTLVENEGIVVDWQTFLRWFDFMGMQRHLKAIGHFARKQVRDNDSRYLADIPRTLNYIAEVVADYPELAELQEQVLCYCEPALQS